MSVFANSRNTHQAWLVFRNEDGEERAIKRRLTPNADISRIRKIHNLPENTRVVRFKDPGVPLAVGIGV